MSANQSVKKKKPQHAQQNPSNQTNQPLQFTAAPVRIETKKYGLLCRCGQLSKQLFGAGAGKSALRLKRLLRRGSPQPSAEHQISDAAGKGFSWAGVGCRSGSTLSPLLGFLLHEVLALRRK